MPERFNPPVQLDRKRVWPRLASALVVATIVAVIGYGWGDELELSRLAQKETRMRQLQLEHAAAVYGVALLLYLLVTGFSIPAATGLSLLYGWYFGFWQAVLVVSFGSTAGATLAFLLSRYLLRDLLRQRYGDRLTKIDANLQREGAYYLFTLRLLPVVPFFLVNCLMGLTAIRVRTFWWVSQVGMLPATLVYVYAGSTAPNLQTLADQGVHAMPVAKIAIALCLLGVLPLATRLFLKRHR